MNAQKNKQLDLKKVEETIYADIDKLLDYLHLEREEMGDNIFMCCPVHGNSDNNRSLSISIKKQCWRCWSGSCHEEYGTGIFGFVMGVLSMQEGGNYTFSDALRVICQIYNIDKSMETDYSEPVERTELHDIVSIFSYEEEPYEPYGFEKIPTIGRSEYFEARGFKRETLKHFGIEDCVDQSCEEMYKRAIIPIHDEDGKQIGHIGRAVKDFMASKYLYSRGLKQSRLLYNEHRAIPKVTKATMFITEGQGDVWRMYEAGVENCVGLFGKDISQSQKLKLLQTGITTLVVLTDNDQPGREAKMKMVRDLNRMFKLVFPRMRRNDIGEMSIESIKNHILTQVERTK